MPVADAEQQDKQPWWRRILTVPGIVIFTAVTTAVSWGVSEGLIRLTTAKPDPQDAVAVTVETDPGRISGVSTADRPVVIPASTRTTGNPGSGCDGFYAWATRNGGVDAGKTIVQIIAQGKHDSAVLLSEMRIKVLSKTPPMQGIPAVCPTAGTAQRRAISVDLDEIPPGVSVDSNGGASPFGFTLAKGETETFIVTASTTQATYRWSIELDLIVDGVRTSVVIGPQGGFATTVWQDSGQHWVWNSQDAWTLERLNEAASDRSPVPADAPLPPLS